MKRLGIRGRILFISSLLLIVAIVLSTLASFLDAKKTIEKQLDEYLVVKTEYLKQKIETYFIERNVILESEADYVLELITDTRSKDELQQYLVAQLENWSKDYGFIDVYIGYPDGTIDCGSLWIPEDPSWKANERSWYIAAQAAKGEIAYTDVYIDAHTKKPVVTIAKALSDGDGNIFGVIAIDISLEQLDALLANEKVGDTGYPFVLAKDGRFIIHPNYTFNEDFDKADTIYNVSGGSLKEMASVFLSENNMIQRGNFAGVEKIYYSEAINGTEFFLVASLTNEEYISELNEMLLHNSIIAVVIIMVSVLILTIFVGKIINAIKRNVVTLNTLSEGNLSFELSNKDLTRKDEIGEIVRATDRLKNSLLSMISEVNNTAASVLTACEELENVSEETAANTEEIEKAVEEVAGGATQQAETTEDVAKHTIVMGEEIEETTKAVENLKLNSDKMKESGTIAMHTLSQLNEINERTKQEIELIYTQTNETNEFAMKIKEAAIFITSIAAQTNLLSLNASIEAARAGETGKGFAVVASEIKSLAQQAGKSAEDIGRDIHTLIKNSSKAVETMDELKGIIESQNNHLERTKHNFDTVYDGINRSTDQIQQISAITKELNDIRVKVEDLMCILSAISEENAASTEETSAATEQLTEAVNSIGEEIKVLRGLSDELVGSISVFKY